MRKIITHSGKFHADDVFAVATIELAHPEEEFKLIRTRDKEIIARGDFIVDVGGENDGKKSFDHHQAGGAGVRENGIPYASFGLVWKEFGAVVCGGDFFVQKQIEDSLVAALDAHDNGVKIYSELYPVSPFEISEYVSIWNHTWKEEGVAVGLEESDTAVFLGLVKWAKSLLQRQITRYKNKNEAYEMVKSIYQNSLDKRIIVLEKYLPATDALMEFPEPVFVIYPQSDSKGWAAKTIPKEKHSFDSKLPFPESWAGKMDVELQKETGVSDAIFCHNKRFLATATSREGAIRLAELALIK